MGITQKAFYHGAALYEICQDMRFSSINSMPNIKSKHAYLLNHNTGLYIKHTTVEGDDGTTKSWRFTITKDEQTVIRGIFKTFKEKTYIVFVCTDEGICVVDYGTLISCVDFNNGENEWCEIYRSDGTSFRIRGNKGEHQYAIPLNAFPRVLFE